MTQLIEILMVDDDPGDVLITQEALQESKLANRLHVCHDGEDAMAFLRREGSHADAPRPDIVFLDLNMPRKNGLETLQEIRADPDLTSIPVVVLTTSDSEQDIIESYKLHANCYVTKPVELESFLKVVRELEDFWLSIVRLPTAR